MIHKRDVAAFLVIMLLAFALAALFVWQWYPTTCTTIWDGHDYSGVVCQTSK